MLRTIIKAISCQEKHEHCFSHCALMNTQARTEGWNLITNKKNRDITEATHVAVETLLL